MRTEPKTKDTRIMLHEPNMIKGEIAKLTNRNKSTIFREPRRDPDFELRN